MVTLAAGGIAEGGSTSGIARRHRLGGAPRHWSAVLSPPHPELGPPFLDILLDCGCARRPMPGGGQRPGDEGQDGSQKSAPLMQMDAAGNACRGTERSGPRNSNTVTSSAESRRCSLGCASAGLPLASSMGLDDVRIAYPQVPDRFARVGHGADLRCPLLPAGRSARYNLEVVDGDAESAGCARPVAPIGLQDPWRLRFAPTKPR